MNQDSTLPTRRQVPHFKGLASGRARVLQDGGAVQVTDRY
jgi:hypothetical protein